jgi:hypothetical protein
MTGKGYVLEHEFGAKPRKQLYNLLSTPDTGGEKC